LKKLSLTIFTNNFITTLLGIFPYEIAKLEAQPTEPVSLNLSFCFEETLYSTFHKCLLPNCSSFGYSVSEKTFLEINQSEIRIACGSHVC
jgi:hypothetical protein